MGFIARDGDLLLQVTKRLPLLDGVTQRPELAYISLSRRSTILPAQPLIDSLVLLEATASRAGYGTWGEGLAYLGLDHEAMKPVLENLGVAIDKAPVTAQSAATVANDPVFQARVAEERERQKKALSNYLKQHQIGRDPSMILVDIGWRGSILRNLQRAFASDPTFRCPRAAFFGLWPEDGNLLDLPVDSVGLISDRRQRSNIMEGSSWYVAFLLEAVCRADEGTTIGYVEMNGKLEALHAPKSPSRDAEAETRGIADQIRRGILEYAETQGGHPDWVRASDSLLRSKAQRALLRLGFFPTPTEIALGEKLVHTETHSPDWATALISGDKPNPLLSPRQWLAGFASPWRAGYVRSTGGFPLAATLLLFEFVLLALPPSVKTYLTEYARKVAGINRNMESKG